MSKISVIVPVYNSSKYLKRCVNSILINSFTDFELLLINDGSEDNSLEICYSFASEDERVVVIDKKNEGVAKTRNLGIQEAKSKYIMFIDNDDFVDKDYLQVHYDLITKNNSKVAITSFRRTDSSGKLVRQEDITTSEWCRYMYTSPWAKIYERQFLIDNCIEFFNYPIGEDVVFNLKLHSLNPDCSFKNYHGYDWFYNEQSVSNTKQTGFDPDIDFIVVLNKIVSSCKLNDYLIYYLKRYIVWFLLYAGKSSSPKKFIDEFKRLYEWLDNQNFTFSIQPFSKQLKGEKPSIAAAVKLFDVLNKTHSVKIFARTYCKG